MSSIFRHKFLMLIFALVISAFSTSLAHAGDISIRIGVSSGYFLGYHNHHHRHSHHSRTYSDFYGPHDYYFSYRRYDEPRFHHQRYQKKHHHKKRDEGYRYYRHYQR